MSIGELNGNKKKAERNCDYLEQLVAKADDFINMKKKIKGGISQQDLDEIAEEIGKLDSEVNRGDRIVQEVGIEVDKLMEKVGDLDVEGKIRRRKQECEDIGAGLNEVQELCAEVFDEIEGDIERIAGTGAKNHVSNLEKFLEALTTVNDQATGLREELDQLEKEIEDCINTRLRPNLTSDERLALTKLNVEYKKRTHDINRRLVQLNNKLIQIDQQYKYKKEHAPKPKPKPAGKGDQVDNLFQDYLEGTECPVPLEKIGKGYYMFGSKKIFAKIINGKLVIRVGGGYMGIDEFVQAYAESELMKMQRYQEISGAKVEEEQYLEIDKGDVHAVGKQKVIGIGQAKKAMKHMTERPKTAHPVDSRAEARKTLAKGKIGASAAELSN